MIKNRKGVSLVALVITIVVLIIITTTVILTVGGDNNIIKRAREATQNYSAKEAQEILVAQIMQYKADMIASTGSVGTLENMIAYFEERNVDVTVVDLSNVMGQFETAFNNKYDIELCINKAGQTTQEQESIVNSKNVFLKLRNSEYLFALDANNFEMIGEVKEIQNSTVITDAMKEIKMLEEIIFKVKQAGLEINAENLQANNMYSEDVTIEKFAIDIDMAEDVTIEKFAIDTDMAEEMTSFKNSDYKLEKLSIRGMSTGYRIRRAVTLVAQATFNKSGMVYNIRANGVIEGSALAEKITAAESRIRDVDMTEE